MGLRSKVLIILLGMWAVITAIIYFYSTSTLINDYVVLEKSEMVKNIDRTRKTLNNLMTSIKVLNGDWSKWDDAYKFMQNKNQAFIDTNLAPPTFTNANLSLILFFKPDGKLHYGLSFNLKSDKYVTLPQNLLAQLEADKTFTQLDKIDENRTGIFKAPAGYIILSASPIVTSQNKGPIRGTLVMGSYFDDKQLATLSDITNIKTNFIPLPLSKEDAEYEAPLSELEKGNPYFISAKNQHLMYGYTFVNDINQRPIGILSIESQRTLFNEGVNTIRQYLALIMCIGIFFIVVVWWLLERLMLKRMINISKQVVSINSENKFSNRIAVQGHDELANMASAINSLMELIEMAQEQLKGRIRQRTEALEQISLLNKNLYSEISKQKEIETKLLEDKQTLRQMAYYDTLTGLPNRQSFNELLRKTLQEAQEKDLRFAILFLDADRFKSINDNYGHVFGDQFLIVTAARLQYAIHNKAVAARISGDEFNIIVTNVVNRSALNQLVQNILTAISAPVTIDNVTVQHSFSIGISVFPNDGTTIESLRRHADIAMYHAKKQPENSWCYYADIENVEDEFRSNQ